MGQKPLYLHSQFGLAVAVKTATGLGKFRESEEVGG